MKIAIICHFTNNQIQDIIKPIKRVKEYAPWISYYIAEFRKYPEHEIHIISPHDWLIKDKIVKEENITFYFFRKGIPIIGRHWPSFFDFDFFTKFWFNKLKVRNYINRLKPDIINLIGAENPYYSSSIMQFKNKFPVLITIQGFYCRGLLNEKLTAIQEYRKDLENKIIKSFNHHLIRTEEMGDFIKTLNKQVVLHRGVFPQPIGKYQIHEQSKLYDFVFFGRVVKDKGIYDYLESIKDIAKVKPDIKAMVIGPCSPIMRDYIATFTSENNLQNNLEHVGFLETQEELFKKVKSAKISVLPTYNDLISGTIIESLFLGLAVVSYKTGSIPEVNKDRENIIICEQGNKKQLTNQMLRILDDSNLRSILSKNGNEWVRNRYDNDRAMNEYFDTLKQISEL